ncbi:hypothetical protein RND81_13G166500 [Saponaria officinalis]
MNGDIQYLRSVGNSTFIIYVELAVAGMSACLCNGQVLAGSKLGRSIISVLTSLESEASDR